MVEYVAPMGESLEGLRKEYWCGNLLGNDYLKRRKIKSEDNIKNGHIEASWQDGISMELSQDRAQWQIRSV